MTAPSPRPGAPRQTGRTALLCGGLAVGMVGLAYASVPLYDAFCKATGYDGTPRQGPALTAAARTGDSMTVHFDTNVAPGLPWKFAPETKDKTLEELDIFFGGGMDSIAEADRQRMERIYDSLGLSGVKEVGDLVEKEKGEITGEVVEMS